MDQSYFVQEIDPNVKIMAMIKNTDSVDRYELKGMAMLQAVKTGKGREIFKVKVTRNQEFVDRHLEIVDSLHPFRSFKPTKLIRPTIPEVEILKTDTPEIKKMIRKLNIKTQSFFCDHNKFDKKFNSFEADLGKVFLCEEMNAINSFYETITSVMRSIMNCDRENKSAYGQFEFINVNRIEHINRKILAVNNKLIELEATYKDLKCHKCESMVREYEITLRTINQMREEHAEELEMAEQLRAEEDDVIAEDTYNINKFMTRHYPSMNRIPLRDICDKYKEVFNIKKTLKEMSEELTKYGWRVTNSKNIFYANRN